MKKSVTLLLVFFSVISVHAQDTCMSSDIEKIDSCLMNKTVRHAISQLNIDTSQFFSFQEPPGILRGIRISLSDTCQIMLYTQRTSILGKMDTLINISWKEYYRFILDKPIIGVSWRKPNQKKVKMIGSRIWYWHFEQIDD